MPPSETRVVVTVASATRPDSVSTTCVDVEMVEMDVLVSSRGVATGEVGIAHAVVEVVATETVDTSAVGVVVVDAIVVEADLMLASREVLVETVVLCSATGSSSASSSPGGTRRLPWKSYAE